MIIQFTDNEALMIELACGTFRAMQGIPVTTSEYERLSKRWEEEKAAALWLLLGKFIDEAQP